MSKEIARLDLDGGAIQRVLSVIASGEDVGPTLDTLAGDTDFGADDFGDDEAGDEEVGDQEFGADDLATVLRAATSGALEDEFGADDANALAQLLAAASGDDELGEDEMGALTELVSRAKRALPRARRAVRRPRPTNTNRRVPPRPQSPRTAAQPAGRSAPPMRYSAALEKVLNRRAPGNGPNTPAPLAPVGGFAVLANNTVTLTVSPPKDYILLGLHLQGDLADRLAVDAITVEGEPLWTIPGSITGSAFRPDSQRANLPAAFCGGGKNIQITIRNLSGADIAGATGNFWGDEGDLETRQMFAEAKAKRSSRV